MFVYLRCCCYFCETRWYMVSFSWIDSDVVQFHCGHFSIYVSCEKAFRQIKIEIIRAKDSEKEPLNFRCADDQFIVSQKKPCNFRFPIRTQEYICLYSIAVTAMNATVCFMSSSIDASNWSKKWIMNQGKKSSPTHNRSHPLNTQAGE